VGWVAHEMNLRKRSRAIVAAGLAAAVVIGAGAGAGTYELLSDHAMTVGGIYEVAHRGVVEITATATPPPPFAQEEQQAQGSGWVYDRKGDIVTNQHVVAGADTLSVRFWNGMTYPATVVGSDRSIDLAVIKVQASSSELHPLQVGDSDALHVGDVVVAIGSPYGLEGTVTSGIISAVHRELKNENDVEVSDLVQTDAAINHGSSGSPLLNAKGTRDRRQRRWSPDREGLPRQRWRRVRDPGEDSRVHRPTPDSRRLSSGAPDPRSRRTPSPQTNLPNMEAGVELAGRGSRRRRASRCPLRPSRHDGRSLSSCRGDRLCRRRRLALTSLGDSVDVFIRREDAERFIEEVRGGEPELAKSLRVEERELEAGGRN
jgi:hypothetical protein